MFKKIELWIVLLIIIFMLLFTIFYGMVLRQEFEGNFKFGKFGKATLSLSRLHVTVKSAFKIVKHGDSISFKTPDQRFDKNLRFTQYNSIDNEYYFLLSRYDPEIKKNVIEIRKLSNFKKIHAYEPDIEKINNFSRNKQSTFKNLKRDKNVHRYYFWHPLIESDGSLVFHSGSPLTKINKCDQVEWVNDKLRFRHSINKSFDDTYWVVVDLVDEYRFDNEIIGSENKFYKDDGVANVSKDGKLMTTLSISRILIDNGYKSLLFGKSNFMRDPIHLNDVQPALYDTDHWKKGDLFFSLRNQSAIIHYRPENNKIINFITGDFYHQHDIDILNDKEIILFNNNSINSFDERKGKIYSSSNIIKYNFETKKFSKIFEKSLKDLKLSSKSQSLQEIFPDKSILVEEQNSGRILYLDKNENIIWEYINKKNDGVSETYDLHWSRAIYDRDIIEFIKMEGFGGC